MKNKNVFAVIIGISQYEDSTISHLKYTDADAESFYNLLLDENKCGVPADNMKLLLGRDATNFNIKDAISGWLKTRVNNDSTTVIYYAGHGGSEASPIELEKTDKYLLPWDTRISNLFASAISCTTFNELLNRVNVKRKVIFMDACYSGGVAKQGSRDLNIIDNPYENLGRGEGTVVIAASQPNQKSWEYDQLGHGIFTYHLLEALNGAADLDKNGEITVWEVIDYLKRKVPDSARKYVHEDQTPYWSGEGSGDIKLTVNIKILEALRLKNDKMYQEKRLKLLEYYGQVPQPVLDEALNLIKKPADSLTSKEQDINNFIDLLLKGDISIDKYIEFRKLIKSEDNQVIVEPRSVKTKADKPITNISSNGLKFCINCGAKIYPGNKFCIHCGTKL